MSWFWAIRHRESGEEQLVESEGCYAPYDGDLYEVAELPREIDPIVERWDWDAGEIVSLITPEKARDEKVRLAKEYREQRRNAPLPVWGVFPDRAVVVNMSQESRITIMGAVNYATLMKANSLTSSFSFDDETGQDITLDGDQTIALGLNVAVFSGLCDGALRTVLKDIATAFAAGASVAEIQSIDITKGYPGEPASPPSPPETPES